MMIILTAGCSHLPVSEKGVWTGALPDSITVKEAARVERPWYGKGVAPFVITVLSGARVGLEWNEGRNMRASEVIRMVPYIGLLSLPYWCYEVVSEHTMQQVANDSGIDKTRQRKYEAVIKRLEQDGRSEEAEYLKGHSPFDLANHPPNPLAKMPKENLDGFWNNTKMLVIDLLVSHRITLERTEGRGLRKLEYWHPLYVTRIYEAFEAAFGRKMEDIAEKARLDEAWLPKEAGVVAVQKSVLEGVAA
ncbi:MAG: hypothetical protein COW12_01945 [Candidatus Omnitrophica bacterium CG12_big_fil_rev_8_21_14_0_65_45_16]|nr:MAG: hypothetical protein COW12_01945 [Candidatus Omnitrophica bacterium CG12_big_fil_rev_8_21_14_0_65_45_16]